MDLFDLRLWPGFGPAGGCLSEPALIDHITIDSRRIDSRHTLFVALKGEKQDGHHYLQHAAQLGVKYALVSYHWQPLQNLKGLKLLRVQDPLRTFQEIAKIYRLQLPIKIIGITGSFGKTMVKDLLYNLLRTEKKTAASPESFNSQIGVPLSLLTLKKEQETAIIEAAISQKQEIDILIDLIRPDYTILAPIGKKHLATLGNLSTLAEETIRFILATPQSGWALLPRHPLLQTYLPQIHCSYYFWNEASLELPHAYSLSQECMTPTPYLLSFPDQRSYQGKMTTGYAYFLDLLNMAVKAAWLTGIQSKSIHDVLVDYQPEPMRTEIWKSPIGATFIHDTYCSDPQSVDKALRHFDHATTEQIKIFVFGGMREQSNYQETDYQRIGKALNQTGLHRLILFGDKPFTPLIEEIKLSLHKPEIAIYANDVEALKSLSSQLRPEDLVLIKGEKKIPLDSFLEAFNDSLNNNQCIINLAAIQANIATLRKKLSPHTRLMIAIKALAYGTDDIYMAKFLSTCGIDIFCVSYVDEGIALKRAGIRQSIFSINAAIYEAAKVVKWDLEVGVSDADLIQALAKETRKQGKQIKVHLHINTGMGRFGCRSERALELASLIQSYHPHLSLEGIMTHFACSEDPQEDEFTFAQVECFDGVIAQLEKHGIRAKWKHAANSSGAIRFQFSQYNMVRIGLAIYGLYASDAVKKVLDLHLALSLTSRIVGINICKKGETISYGRSYKVEKEEQKIAVLPIGYFDGLHRHYSGKAHVLIRGYQAPMVGNICMDYLMVDVTDIPHVAVGDKVLIFGEDEFGYYLSPEELAANGKSIIHELMTCLGPRIQRVFVYEEGCQIR